MKHRLTTLIAITAALATGAAFAEDGPDSNTATGLSSPPPREWAPMTRSERFINYLTHVVDPESVFRAAASAGIKQASGNPFEWGGGSEAYGERFGSALAQHVIQRSLMYGSSWALHEDNRYFLSGQSGFLRRTKYAIRSTFLARHDDGHQSLSFSRIGSTAGAAFISRIWQPRSETTAGDGAVSFGINMGAEVGLNVFREFWPDMRRHLHKK